MADPVADWANDFDIFDREFVQDPYPIYQELRERAPIAHTERWGGLWLATRYEDVQSVTEQPERFSSASVVLRGPNPGEAGNQLQLPPLTDDPPAHGPARRVLLPAFTPAAIAKQTVLTRRIARGLIADIRSAGNKEVDAARSYAEHLPVRVISAMIGVPAADADRFKDWVVRMLQLGPQDPHALKTATQELLAYLAERVDERAASAERPDDLISYLLAAEIDGQPLPRRRVIGTCFVLLVAGIDTTWSSIAAALWHLATHPEDRRRLVREPELLPTAIEEFLRAYSPVTIGRIVTQDTEFGGRQLHAGDRLAMSFPAINRDPAIFDDPERVRIDRQVNRHAAFGLGIHRCLGSNLARMELLVALEEWLAAFPEFALVEGSEVEWTGGTVRGPRRVPVLLGGAGD